MSKILARVPFNSSPILQRLALLSITSLVLTLVMSHVTWQLLAPVNYHKGEVAKYTVRATRDYLVEDILNTESKRAEAISNVRAVFAINDAEETSALYQLHSFFAAIESNSAIKPPSQILELSKDHRANIEKQFSLDLVGEEWDIVLNPNLWQELEQAAITVAQPILNKGIIANKLPLNEALAHGQAVLRSKSDGGEHALVAASAVYDTAEALATARIDIPAEGYGRGILFDAVARKLTISLLQPNLIYDAQETDNRIQKAANEVEVLYTRVPRGQIVVQAGDTVTLAQEARLKQLAQGQHPLEIARTLLATFLLSATFMAITYLFISNFWPNADFSVKDLVMIALSLVGSFVLIKLHSILSQSLSYSFPSLDADTFILATPLATCGILLQSTLGAASVIMFVIPFALLTGVFVDNSWLLIALIVAGTFVGALSISRSSRRSGFLLASVHVCTVNALIAVVYVCFSPSLSSTENIARVCWAVLGGVVSGIIGGGLTPVVEFLGGYITDIKLLELASLDRPLLRELSVQAPGTWTHSMVVAQLCEAAANSIGANGLLARVGAYYHDIGKANKPAYFVENQVERENRHDKLPPSMSALIIKSHVKDGFEMAEAGRLPQVIIDFILQHHGTSLIDYFYVKALKEAEENQEGEEVDETVYRYSGPRPQTKEAAILMLADGVEAAARTLADPSPAKIQGLVQKIINKVFASGELEESPLTLRDLHLIAKSFTRMLSSIYHRRIQYSEPAEKVRDSSNSKITKLIPRRAEGSRSESGKGEEIHGEEAQQEQNNQKRANGRSNGETEGRSRTQESSSKKGTGTDTQEALKRLGL